MYERSMVDLWFVSLCARVSLNASERAFALYYGVVSGRFFGESAIFISS